jgi:hypothetical protein
MVPQNEENAMARKAVKKKAKKPASKTAKKPAKKKAKKATKATAGKPAKKVARKKPTTEAIAAIESTVRSFDARPDFELAHELETTIYGVDLHNDPDEVAAESVTTEAAPRWRVAKALLKLRAQVNAMAPNRNKASDGTIGDTAHCGSPSSTSDHCPLIRDAGVGVVAAMDITHDPSAGCDAGRLANAIHASRDSRVKYIIWNRRIANSSPQGGSPAWAWRHYGGRNPHNHHVHISVKPGKPRYDSESPWTLTGG